jgi:biopolymer transport protein TolR
VAKAKRRKPMAEINVVPYIDVMLVLLVIFMVAAPLLVQGIQIEVPKANTGPLELDQDEPALVVSVDGSGQYFINVGDQAEPVPLEQIADRATRILAANPDIKVLVEGDATIPYGNVVQLMSILQTAGAENIGLITEPPGA